MSEQSGGEDRSLRGRKGSLTKSMNTLFPQTSSDKCRVCNEPVVDSRWNYCSERCRKIANAVQRMFTWNEVRDAVLERDGYRCQECGIARFHYRLAKDHIADRVRELAEPLEKDEDESSREYDYYRWVTAKKFLRDRYNYMEIGEPPAFEVDHIQPISKGGHPFDERNLQTLCEDCHKEKTARENSSKEEQPEVTLQEYVLDD